MQVASFWLRQPLVSLAPVVLEDPKVPRWSHFTLLPRGNIRQGFLGYYPDEPREMADEHKTHEGHGGAGFVSSSSNGPTPMRWNMQLVKGEIYYPFAC